MGASPAAAQWVYGEGFDHQYLGVHAGYGFANFDVDAPPFGRLDGAGFEGVAGGAVVGFGRTYGQLYTGLEVEGTFTDIDNKIADGTQSLETDIDWIASPAVRVGFLPSDKWMVFGRAGPAWAHFESDFREPGLRVSDDTTELGFLVGGGIEGFVTQNISIRADYSFYRFTETVLDVDVDANIGIGRIGISYNF